jgi:ABC-2 type transport system permease protein
VNAALSRFVYDWRSFKTNGRYATTKDLIGYFRNVAPDSMQSVITDLFEKIVLFENKTEEVIATQLQDSTWQVDIAINAKKLEADTLGVEQEVAINDWVDIGVYGKDEEGEDKLLYIQKHLINTEADTIQVVVPSEPTRAGIDPINKLIDRNPNDNVKWAEKEALQ